MLECEEFKGWLNQPGKAMICPGIPGAGKTVIAATVIHHLQEGFQNDSSVGIAYVYFSYQAKIDQTVSNIIGSLGRQLVERLQTVPVEIMNHNEERRRPSHGCPLTGCWRFCKLSCVPPPELSSS